MIVCECMCEFFSMWLECSEHHTKCLKLLVLQENTSTFKMKKIIIVSYSRIHFEKNSNHDVINFIPTSL